MILHIIGNKDWQNANNSGEYSPDSLNTEGFIHCSTLKQTVEIANLFFKGATDLKILCINEEKTKSKIVYEDTENFGQLFPHIYGPLNLDAVFKVVDLHADENGQFLLPNELIVQE
ncbi:DUF952 domain-containing protein [Gottfriedia acidiceleris]|uniref:DUF952 domain-containing protein n=1 Tax=Gottfriedia acidiceleris TaxID=371036 RepID=A0ABY4JNH0_9BACI|nr:DUF952 domain-containing protein [Gottfriedia acidiceleris]UPM55396.1 DUF952 domain-containing protein [Gottfriedia acidiceleris]